MIHWTWLIPAAFVGGIVGAVIGWLSLACRIINKEDPWRVTNSLK